MLKRARADSGDVPAAAAALGVRVAEHTAMMQRTNALVGKRIAQANANGDLGDFNRQYRVYRVTRTLRGQPAMSYTTARSRLRRALVEHAAGKAKPGAIVTRVFER